MKKLPKVGILVPTKDDIQVIGSTLIALLGEVDLYTRCGGSVDISLINDGSTDGTGEVLKSIQKEWPCKLIEHSKNKGVTVSHADGFDQLDPDCEAVLRCDADASFIRPGWLAEMVRFLFSDERVGVIAPLMIWPNGHVASHGMSIFPDGETEIDRGRFSFEPEVRRIIEVDTVYGAYSMMRKEDWTIDENYFLWVEDEDQGLTVRKKGKKCFCLGNLLLVHYSDLRISRVDYQKAKEQHLSKLDKVNVGLQHLKSGMRIMSGAVMPENIKGKINAPKQTQTTASDQTEKFDKRIYHPIRNASVEYFEKKWKFSLLQPDMEQVKKLYSDTELLWSYSDEKTAVGKEIIRKFNHGNFPERIH